MGSRTVRQTTLDVVSLAILTVLVTHQAVSGQAKARAVPQVDRYQIPAGTVVSLRLRTPIDSSTSQANDQIDAVLTEPVTQEGVELIPVGSSLQGTIVKVAAASREAPLGQVSFAFAVVQHAETSSRAPFRTRPITIEAQRPAPPVGKRDKSKNQPIDVSWPAGHSFSATLAEPLLVGIPKSTDQQ